MTDPIFQLCARRGAEVRIAECEAELVELRAFLGAATNGHQAQPAKRSKMSAAGRAAISRAMKARWKKYRASQR